MKARDVLKRYERVLRVVGRASPEHIDEKSWMPMGAVFAKDPKLADCYPDLDLDGTEADELRADLAVLRSRDWIVFTVSEGPVRTWALRLQFEGLRYIAELEKCRFRRAYEKNPAAWWQVALTFLAVVISVIALVRSYGGF